MKLLLDFKGKSYLVDGESDFHSNYGMIKGDDIKNSKPGDIIHSNKGDKFSILEPDILDFIHKAKRGPQAVTLKDMGLIVAFGGIKPGSRVLESGTGSGLLSMYIASIVYPEKLVTYELREDFAKIASKNFKKFGFDNIELRNQNVYEGIDEESLDAIVFDLPDPWEAIEHADKALRVGGRIVSYSPSVNQVNKFVEALPDYFFNDTFECIKRDWKAKTMRPDTRMLGHTGFLTVARKLR